MPCQRRFRRNIFVAHPTGKHRSRRLDETDRQELRFDIDIVARLEPRFLRVARADGQLQLIGEIISDLAKGRISLAVIAILKLPVLILACHRIEADVKKLDSTDERIAFGFEEATYYEVKRTAQRRLHAQFLREIAVADGVVGELDTDGSEIEIVEIASSGLVEARDRRNRNRLAGIGGGQRRQHRPEFIERLTLAGMSEMGSLARVKAGA
jgi:hypothetical protein